MFKNKIKYSLLAGSLYNIKCDFTFNVYIDGQKTELTKTLKFDEIEEYKTIGRKVGKENLPSYDKDTEDRKKEGNDPFGFDNYIQWMVFYEYIDEECNVFKDEEKILKDKDFIGAKFDNITYNNGKVDYKAFEFYKKQKSVVNIYYVSKVQYKILNKDKIKGLKENYDTGNWNYIESRLKYYSELHRRITYKELIDDLKCFSVGISACDYANWTGIPLDSYNNFISDDDAKRIVLDPDITYYKENPITINLENGNTIKINSYGNIKISELISHYTVVDKNSYWKSIDKKEFALKEGYFKFFNKENKELTDKDLVQDNMTCKCIKYRMSFHKIDKNKKVILLSSCKDCNVEDLDKEIENIRGKYKLNNHKVELYKGYDSNLFIYESYKNYLDYRIAVVFIEQGENSKADEHKVEESIEKQTEKKPIEKPKEKNPKGETPIEEKPKYTDSEVVKKTALINECNKLVNEIKALNSSYDKTINNSDSVENLEILKTELTNKLNELKNKEPKDKEVPENPNPKNTEPTSITGGNTEKNKKMCGSGYSNKNKK